MLRKDAGAGGGMRKITVQETKPARDFLNQGMFPSKNSTSSPLSTYVNNAFEKIKENWYSNNGSAGNNSGSGGSSSESSGSPYSGGSSYGSGNSGATGGSSSYSSSTTTSGGGGNYYNDYLQQMQSLQDSYSSALREQQAQYQAQLEAQQRAKQEAAQNAYNNNMSALQTAYQNKLSGLASNYDSTKGQLAQNYNDSVNALNQKSSDALRQAYINNMTAQRNLKNQLNQQGINGGASESAVASLLNSYGNSRNNIDTTAQQNLASLRSNYDTNQASALQNYNDAVNSANDANLSYKMQLENDLANQTVGSYDSLYSALGSMDSTYANAMTNLLANQASNASDLAAAAYAQMLKNTASKSSTVSGGTSGSINNTALNRARQLIGSGVSMDDAASSLYDEGYSVDDISQIFANLGVW